MPGGGDEIDSEESEMTGARHSTYGDGEWVEGNRVLEEREGVIGPKD